MRIPQNDENLAGKVCVTSTGRTFIVTGKALLSFGEAWVGLGLDGNGNAASISPGILAESGQEFHDKLADRFGGKPSFNT